ncbi:MAG: DUF3999 family protein, partial [Sphaerotilus sp.]|nr:DUF3999 family protein [Sphaerotilus sp.]
MQRLWAQLWVLLWVLPAVALHAAELPGRDDYAYGFPLTAGAGSEYYMLDLPLEVYRSVADPALRDIGVYNADGQPVPRLIERPESGFGRGEDPEAVVEAEIALGLIPLYGRRAEPSEQLRLLLLQGGNSTRLELDTERPAAADEGADVGAEGAEAERTLAGYLVDTRDLEHALQALSLAWPPLPEGFIGTVRVDTSDDLQHWRHLGSAALAELEFEQTRIEQRRVPLDRTVADYLRISWQDMPAGWRLSAVHGLYAGADPALPREWLELDPLASGAVAGERLFDAGGYPPVDRVNLLLPDGNVVVRAGIYYRPPGSEQWRLAHSGVFYNLTRQGNRLRSPAAVVPGGSAGPPRAAHWQVRVESGVLPEAVRLQLGWRPDRLLFVAQGPAPFALVSGRAQDEIAGFPQATVLGDTALFQMLRRSGPAGPVAVGSREALAGPAALQLAETVRWKVLGVWAG